VSRGLSTYLAFGYAKYYLIVAVVVVAPALGAIRDPHAWYIALVALSFAATAALFMFVYELGRRREFETLQSFGVPFAVFATPPAVISLAPQLLLGTLAVAIAREPLRAAPYALAALLGVAGPLAIVLVRCWRRPSAGVAAPIVLGLCGWVVAAGLCILSNVMDL
jgi:hypothetical protein